MNWRTAWDFVLMSVDGESFTVGSLVTAVAVILVGYGLSRVLSRQFARMLSRRGRLDDGAASAVETLGFYVLFGIFVFTTLTLVHFPMTVFTLGGGAIAIGIGFGSQQVMRNLISGLILHLERPIRVGDLVEVEGTHGTVEGIGTRSTRIRAADNTHIVLPNSFFLDNKVVNLTLSDDIIRTRVRVGVVYGSPTREVERILLQVLSENEMILTERESRIVFSDFGDDALIFEMFFWVRAKAIMDRRMVESAVRFRVDELFRAAGIVIAFPQRDVHLDTVRPLDVRVIRDGAERPS